MKEGLKYGDIVYYMLDKYKIIGFTEAGKVIIESAFPFMKETIIVDRQTLNKVDERENESIER